MQLNYREMLDYGVEILSSGTTGEKKHILRSPGNLEACNKVAIEVQMITAKSRIYTCTKMDHAGGLLLQTLPAYTLGCDIKITTFNPYQFLTEFQDYTHTFLPPKMCQAVMQTKAFATCDLSDKIVAMGSDRIDGNEIQAFIDKGATVIANWGMSEIGPNAINKVYNKNDTIDFTKNILGDTTQCETKIIDGQLYVKGPTCIYSGWFATGDLVTFENDTYSFIKRK
jgi:fatty-acyl-CoA synthase|tara:strand:- start:2535 stop:3212 length:678 start_codon:yes stop_codon:yes gene_type:complete